MALEDYIREQEKKAGRAVDAGKTEAKKAWEDTKAAGRDIVRGARNAADDGAH